MKKIVRLALLLSLSAVFAGCATTGPRTAMLTYDSNPAGATIYEGGKSLGIAPVTRTYEFGESASSIATPEVTAVWTSGAKATYWTNLSVRADLAATIDRPLNAPGLDKDQAAAKPLLEQRARDAERLKEENMRETARNSSRCREQMQKGNVATSDC
jgi:hypothetical protein